MYYPDLTSYSYLRTEIVSTPENYLAPENSVDVLNVGWLEHPYPFEKGEVPLIFIDKLLKLCLNSFNKTRGYHVCNICENPMVFPMKIKTGGIEAVFNLPLPTTIIRGEVQMMLGTAEVRVVGQTGLIYAAPDLIYHYVTEHKYLPPQEFIEAVLNS